MKLYHGTNIEGFNGIMSDGVITTSINGRVYLTPRHEMALEYGDGENVVTVDVCESRLHIDHESFDDDISIDEAIDRGLSVYVVGDVKI